MSSHRTGLNFRSAGLFSVFAVVGSTFGACADETLHAEDRDPLASIDCPANPMDGGIVDTALDGSAADEAAEDARVPSFDGGPSTQEATFESITANGTGCPRGTWTSNVSPDGEYLIKFESFDLEISPSAFQATKDCNLAIKVHAPEGTSYAVSEFFYHGYALVEDGVSLEQTAAYGFQGTSVNLAGQNRTTLPKPPAVTYDSDFVFKDTIETTDLIFSACGLSRDLNVKLRLSLKNGVNGKPRAHGYANLSQAVGLKLVSRRCSRTPAVAKPGTGPLGKGL